VVIYDFDVWCIEETKFSSEGSFVMDYQWFSGVCDGFWLEHACKLACLYCMENNKAFTLTNGGKISFFFIAIDGFANQSQL
jgi:hypothetical protein